VYVKRLGVALHEVCCLAKRCPALEVSTLIGCAKVLTSLIAFDVENATAHFQWCESLSAQFLAVALEIGRAIVCSPIYPHIHVTRPIGFLLRAAFDDLAAGRVQKPHELLAYLLNGRPDPSSVMFLSSGSNPWTPRGCSTPRGTLLRTMARLCGSDWSS
jgi:hypothetical protein